MRQPTTANAERLQTVYRTTFAELSGYVLVHTSGDRELAEDLVSETYFHAARRAQQGRVEEVTIGWLKTVARRRLLDHIRREISLRGRADRLKNEVASARSEEIPDRSELSMVYEALDTLPSDHRLVLVLNHLDGLRVREIAEIIERSPDATESLLRRARSGFRAAYRSMNDD